MRQYQPTIIETGFLFERLLIQFEFLCGELKHSWILFNDDPTTFSKAKIRGLARRLQTLISTPNVVPAVITAVAAIFCIIAVTFIIDRKPPHPVADEVNAENGDLVVLDFSRTLDSTNKLMLRVVFASNGQVAQIRAVHSLPYGLTERAIAAAREIKFVPAVKGGQPVSVFMQLEYNFNLY